MQRKESSDERLLKIIEGKAESHGRQGVGIKNKGIGGLGIPRLRFSFGLPVINKMLIAVGIVATAFLFIAASGNLFMRDADLFLAPVSPVAPAPGRGSAVAKIAPASWQSYAEAFERRHIFLPAGKQAFEKQAAVEKVANTEELFKDFKLVGVIWSSNPEVMIESAKEQRTVLVKKGETFGVNSIRVKAIAKNSVTLEVDTGGGNLVEYQLR
jgi:hypothetical protein